MMESIFIRKAEKNNLTIVSNEILNDPSLSWAEKGFLCFLESLPEDSDISDVILNHPLCCNDKETIIEILNNLIFKEFLIAQGDK